MYSVLKKIVPILCFSAGLISNAFADTMVVAPKIPATGGSPMTLELYKEYRSHLAPVDALRTGILGKETFNLIDSAEAIDQHTLQLTPDSGQGHAAAWLNKPISTSVSFSVSFKYELVNSPDNSLTEGIAFILQNKGSDAMSDSGVRLGFPGSNSVAWVVQTLKNDTLGLVTNNIPYSAKPAPTYLMEFSKLSGVQTISYDASSHYLKAFGSIMVGGKSYEVSDSVNIDLAARLGPVMYLGFAGGTGSAIVSQTVTDIEFEHNSINKPIALEEERMRIAYDNLRGLSIPVLEQAQQKFEEFKQLTCAWKKSITARANRVAVYEHCAIELMRWRTRQLQAMLPNK